MPQIILVTFTARYHHCALGLRYLQANLNELEPQSALLEFDLEKSPIEAAEAILALSPRIVALSVHIWNTRPAGQLAALLKQLRPEVRLVMGGPEVSFPGDPSPVAELADHVIAGEGDLAFGDLCRDLLAGRTPPHWIQAPPPDLAKVQMPYRLYSSADLAHRTVYVESSRGCPFGCEFCLSSLDIPLRRFPLQPFLAQMQALLDRGLLAFKFVDRTFNVDRQSACAILDFFLERYRPGLFLHFEVIPDHLPDELKGRLARFPAGSLQLEIGIQTLSEEVASRIGRRQNNALAQANLRWLREHTQAHLHADLVAGLPGESLQSFAEGFDRLYALRPHEIQLGVLKRLRGAPIARHTQAWQMLYSDQAPYEILQTRHIPFESMQQLRRMARYWDMVANSGQFPRTLPLLLGDAPFQNMMALGNWLYARTGRTHAIALPRLFELLLDYAAAECSAQRDMKARALADDYLAPGRRDLPPALAAAAPATAIPRPRATPGVRRQQRHQNHAGSDGAGASSPA